MAIYTEKQTGNVSVMVLLFEAQSTVATRANFCVFILEKKQNKNTVRINKDIIRLLCLTICGNGQ